MSIAFRYIIPLCKTKQLNSKTFAFLNDDITYPILDIVMTYTIVLLTVSIIILQENRL